MVFSIRRYQSAEIKHTSPSKGEIVMTVNPAQLAVLYAKVGASMISVLTEPTWFKPSRARC